MCCRLTRQQPSRFPKRRKSSRDHTWSLGFGPPLTTWPESRVKTRTVTPTPVKYSLSPPREPDRHRSHSTVELPRAQALLSPLWRWPWLWRGLSEPYEPENNQTKVQFLVSNYSHYLPNVRDSKRREPKTNDWLDFLPPFPGRCSAAVAIACFCCWWRKPDTQRIYQW